MCAIAGCFSFQNLDPKPLVHQMLEGMLHRGYSFFEMSQPDPSMCLGANRLEIVDRPNGKQPIPSWDKRFHVVLNGEIYNYQALRKRLLQQGCLFKTETDTEVIANAISAWGIDKTLNEISGMFAFGAWDNQEKILYLARDPLGIKPLYMASLKQGFYFASEIKGLNRAVSGEFIEYLSPGTLAIIKTQGKKEFKSFFSLPEKLPVSNSKAEDITPERLRSLISEAVQKRVNTDLPVAVLLSGGIDSSIIFYEAQKFHQDVTPFVIGDEKAEDVISAKKFCKELGKKIHHIPFSVNDALSLIEETIEVIETFEPNHIRAGVASLALAKAIHAEGFRIALCGEGADELFAGYPEFILAASKGISKEEILEQQLNFIKDLHRTQLQRVDRTGMANTLEIRTPFLDKEIIKLALKLPFSYKLREITSGVWTNKWILREAYRGILPDWLVDRPKCVLSEGAGLGANGPEGPFHEYAHKVMKPDEVIRLQKEFPEYDIKNAEEALYFSIFIKKFPGIKTGLPRPAVTRR